MTSIFGFILHIDSLTQMLEAPRPKPKIKTLRALDSRAIAEEYQLERVRVKVLDLEYERSDFTSVSMKDKEQLCCYIQDGVMICLNQLC